MAIRWGLSILDWRSHAIDERADHPIGVYRAQCGHVLMMVTELFDRPNGALCQMCVETGGQAATSVDQQTPARWRG